MTDNTNTLPPEVDANIKFEKLCEVTQKININGKADDEFPVQTVLKAILDSDNSILWQKLTDSLINDNNSELLDTFIAGLFLQKGNYTPLIDHSQKVLGERETICEDLADKESLIICIEGLVKAVSSENEILRQKALKPLFNLYKASCHAQSSAMLADKLLQQFMVLLANKNEVINQNLFDIVKNKNSEINAKLISIDILSRSVPEEFFETAKELLVNIDDKSRTAIEKVYLLDVLTKYVFNTFAAQLNVNISELINKLNELDINKSAEKAKAEYQGENKEKFDTISERIKKRIADLNKANS